MIIIPFRDNVSEAAIYSARLTGFFSCFYSMKTNVTTLKKTSRKKSLKNKKLKDKTEQNKEGRFSDR